MFKNSPEKIINLSDNSINTTIDIKHGRNHVHFQVPQATPAQEKIKKIELNFHLFYMNFTFDTLILFALQFCKLYVIT